MDAGGPIYVWQCSYGTSQGCPGLRPRLGQSCSQPNLECSYDVCGTPLGLSVQCDATTGTWQPGFASLCAGGL